MTLMYLAVSIPGETMSDFEFVDSDLGTNEDLLHRVREVLAEIYLKAPSDIKYALACAGSSPTDLRSDSIRLLYYYQFVSVRRRPVAFFLESAVNNPLRALIRTRADLEDAAANSVLHRTALEIIKVFMVCLQHREEFREYKTLQRGLLSKNRAKFFEALVLRDGNKCAHCKSRRKKLVIDHIKPIANRGLTELVNLQLLCFGCNSEKSDRFIAA